MTMKKKMRWVITSHGITSSVEISLIFKQLQENTSYAIGNSFGLSLYCLPIIVNSFQTAPALKQKGEGGSDLFPHVRVRANLQGLVLHMKMLEKERLHRCLN
ncbi:hypothetical protein L2E82_30012 [Cichorium intybus]|uniref:Uncharacterized protein n=1 Tax=Cichorium intybus TaxID=13427 RepID=A0ACB9CZI4_CICIN|nr:hypothetical protein L2E82_30012 [Cichorium intybus]